MDMIAHLLGAIALDKDRTLRITIRIETRKCDRNTEMKSDRPTGNFEVLGFAIEARSVPENSQIHIQRLRYSLPTTGLLYQV
jgi:hypothetical protein